MAQATGIWGGKPAQARAGGQPLAAARVGSLAAAARLASPQVGGQSYFVKTVWAVCERLWVSVLEGLRVRLVVCVARFNVVVCVVGPW